MNLSGARLAAILADADCWRGAPLDAPSVTRLAPAYKEWQHFVVFGDGWTLLYNLSLDGGAGRTITIFCQDAWHGQIDRCSAPTVRNLDATFDRAGMRWRAGRYELWRQGPGVRFECVLTPRSVPSLSHNIRLGPGADLSWCLVPQLEASGWVEHDGRRMHFHGRRAYHDHNWGRFAWGGDFSWDWGCAVPDDPASPWTVIFARMNDRAHHRTTAASVFVLKDGRHLRYFRNDEVRFTSQGAMPPRSAGRVPAAAALLLPDHDHDVPQWTRFEARRGDDILRGEVEGRVRGQVLVPSETDLLGVVRLNEVHTRVRVQGRCAGETVDLDGPGLLEVVRG